MKDNTCMAVCKQTDHRKTTQVAAPSLHLFSLYNVDPIYLIAKLRRMSCLKKKDAEMGLLVSFYDLSCLHTAIHLFSSSCGFWHCHPYIPPHFFKVLFVLVS